MVATIQLFLTFWSLWRWLPGPAAVLGSCEVHPTPCNEGERHTMRIPRRAHLITAGLTAVVLSTAGATSAFASQGSSAAHQGGQGSSTATPIKHLVVIFDENVSFDHYFGTYPYAPNPAGEPAFHAKPGTPTVNGLYNQLGPNGPTGPLLTNNPNGSNPLRLGPSRPDDLRPGPRLHRRAAGRRSRRRGPVPAEHRRQPDPGRVPEGLHLQGPAGAGAAGCATRTRRSWTTTTATP